MGKNTKIFGENNLYNLTCKQTGKVFTVSDARVPNEISFHIKNELGIDIPTNFEKKKYLNRTGQNWYYQFFEEPVPVSKPESLTCKICGWQTLDLTNKSGAYTNHVIAHGVTVEEYIKTYPEEKQYFNKYNLKEDRDKHLSDPKNSIQCLECGEYFTILNHKHVYYKHGLTMDEYKQKHNIYKTTSDNYTETHVKPFYEKNLRYSGFKKVSNIEKEFIKLLSENNVEHIVGDRNLLDGLEVDILIPSLNIAIEFDGLLYHSELYGKKSRSYHLNKTNKAYKKGYRLIHVFEDESYHKRAIVFNKLKHILKIGSINKVYARKCYIKEITLVETNQFLLKNHIQGEVKDMKYSYGAFYDGNLISVMVFNNKRVMSLKNGGDRWELTRFASDVNYNVIGIGGKLLSYFIKTHPEVDEIISFADLRWTDRNKNIYLTLGFRQERVVPPNYFYLNGKISRHKRLSKFGYGISSLKRKGMYIEGMSEWECMKHHGFDRIWDCGMLRYVYNRKG